VGSSSTTPRVPMRAPLLGLQLLLYCEVVQTISVEGISSHQGAKQASEYWAEGRQIFTNAFQLGDEENSLQLKGFNWYGFESKSCTYGGSWTSTPVAAIIDAMRRKGFNAIRIPLALAGCPPRAEDELEELVRTAGDHGMLVLLAIETMRAGVPNDTGYIGGADGAETVRRGWEQLAARFCDPNKYWNVIGADLLNSPHGMSWGPAPPKPEVYVAPYEEPPKMGDSRHCLAHNGQGVCPPPPPPPRPPPVYAHYYPDERWDVVAGKLADSTLGACPRWLAVVEGVGYCQTSSQEKGCEYPSAAGQDTTMTTWWGENLQGVREHPVQLSPPHADMSASKIVYAAQVHAPSTGHQDYFADRHFPSNMPHVWDLIWGHLPKSAHDPHAMLLVDWGAATAGDDLLWQQALATYLVHSPIVGSFYGAINPDAKSTGGLLTSWEGPVLDDHRIDLLSALPATAVPTTVMIQVNKPPPPSPPPARQSKSPPPAPHASPLADSWAERLNPPPPPDADDDEDGTITSMVARDPVGAALLVAVVAAIAYFSLKPSAGPTHALPLPAAVNPGGEAAPRSAAKSRASQQQAAEEEQEEQASLVQGESPVVARRKAPAKSCLKAAPTRQPRPKR